MKNIDYDKLREDLEEDSLAGAFGGGFSAMLLDVSDTEDADEDELEDMAERKGFNLDDYRRY